MHLTKTRFQLGRECPTKLYYCDRRSEYHNANLDDTFLQGLAEGGYQVGELARWMLCNNPATDVVTTLNHNDALAETRRRLAADKVTVAEAAFSHNDLFIRADIVAKDGDALKLYEVKSKSWINTDSFWPKKATDHLASEWESYLLDVAFQKYVVERACPKFKVQAFLVLLDKGKHVSVDGLNQLFPVSRINGRIQVVSRVASRQELGTNILAPISVDRDIDQINGLDFELPDGTKGNLEDLIEQLSTICSSGNQFFCGVGSKCKTCQFQLPSDPQTAAALRSKGVKSGLDECWAHAVGGAQKPYDTSTPKVIDVWNYRGANEALQNGKFFIEDLTSADLGEGKRAKRQWLQVDKVKKNDASPWIDKNGLAARMAQWKFPLHFIDFETARFALPCNKGMAPYTQVAFQFSHHTVDKDGTVRHAGQWIEVQPGRFPSFDFVRALKVQLDQDHGTIFRYAAHENSVLRDILEQLDASSEPDRADLMAWIATATEYLPAGGKLNDKIRGPRNMVDMKELVVDYHYDPATHGSNSLKAVLPAIISSSDNLRARYGQPLSQSGVHSLNCPRAWIWVRPEFGNDPYAALPRVFDAQAETDLSDYARGLEELDDGGAATIAYAKLQFFDLPDAEREAIRQALLRYCELDTLAMVMLFEYWRRKCSL